MIQSYLRYELEYLLYDRYGNSIWCSIPDMRFTFRNNAVRKQQHYEYVRGYVVRVVCYKMTLTKEYT